MARGRSRIDRQCRLLTLKLVDGSNPSSGKSLENFKNRMDTMLERFKRSPRAKGVAEILMPGEPEALEEIKRRTTGIPIDPQTRHALEQEAGRCGVPFPPGALEPLSA